MASCNKNSQLTLGREILPKIFRLNVSSGMVRQDFNAISLGFSWPFPSISELHLQANGKMVTEFVITLRHSSIHVMPFLENICQPAPQFSLSIIGAEVQQDRELKLRKEATTQVLCRRGLWWKDTCRHGCKDIRPLNSGYFKKLFPSNFEFQYLISFSLTFIHK